MDFYLNKEHTYQRLLREYRQYNSLVVAFDFDNTVYDFHGKGWQFPKLIQLLKELKKIGCYLIIFTANEDEELIKQHCQKHQIPYDAINENPPFYQSTARKIYFNILLDDRAGLKESYVHLTKLIEEVKSTKVYEQ